MPERFRGELLTMGRYTNPASFTFYVCTTYIGLAYYQSICTQYSAAIVREAGQYSTTQTITHELAHT